MISLAGLGDVHRRALPALRETPLQGQPRLLWAGAGQMPSPALQAAQHRQSRDNSQAVRA